MSATKEVSPTKLTMRPKSQIVIRNYNNPDYHTSLDLAKAYSGMVDTHLFTAQYENHTLKSAQRVYKKELLQRTVQGKDTNERQIKRAKSSLNIWERRNKSNKKTINIQDNKVVRNPEDGEAKSMLIEDEGERQRKAKLKQLLTRKTFRVPEYSQQLDQACSYKAMLQKQINKLQVLINSEKKKKTKISLNCNKIMNERQLTYKNYKTTEEENFHLNTNIIATQRQNQFLREQINKLNQKNKKTVENVQQQKNECDELKKFVQKTRLIVFEQEKDVAKLKTMVTTSYNNMSNNFMNMNLLKSEKALLLSDIDANHSKNR